MAATTRLTPAEIAAKARALGLDPDAVLRVGSAEGLSGGIGDGGHAFGPWQLNNAGGVITGKFPGQTPEQINEWAWSPQGVDYALGGIDRVAHGLTGPAAVSAIVNRFERPADPQGEIARALGHSVMAGSSTGRTPGLPGGGGSMPQPAQSPIAAALANRVPRRPMVAPQALSALVNYLIGKGHR